MLVVRMENQIQKIKEKIKMTNYDVSVGQRFLFKWNDTDENFWEIGKLISIKKVRKEFRFEFEFENEGGYQLMNNRQLTIAMQNGSILHLDD